MVDLSRRVFTPERMDTDCRDYADYAACLRDLSRVNAVTFTHRPMLRWLRRMTCDLPPGESFTLLDVACGHGDALRRVRGWSRGRGLSPRLIGIDLNPWAIRAAVEATAPSDAVEFYTADAFALESDVPFDFIVSSQFTHHLTDADVVAFVRWMERTARRGWFVGDLHRHVLPYYGFPLLARAAFWHRFVRGDGQISIARAFQEEDWRAILAAAGVSGAEIRWFLPFRLCVSRA